MATFSIESNGRLEKTAIYINGEQLGGIKEVFLNLDEEGTFDSIIQYEGTDKAIYTKQIFTEYLENVKVVDPTFTEEEAQELQLFTVESDGEIDNTTLLYNNEPLEGVVSIFLHIKAAQAPSGGLKSLFAGKNIPDHVQFKAEITFRNEGDIIETENLF
jgi:hypothetical protein